MTITTEIRTVDVTLRMLRGNYWQPDCLADLEDGRNHMSDKELDWLIDYWEDEVNLANSGKDGESLRALTSDEIDRGIFWSLSVSPVDC